MIFVNHFKSSKAAQDYFQQHLSPGDYFSKDAAEMKGQWHGRGAEMLRLSGEVDKDAFFALCQNRNPETGEKLTPRTRDDRRVLTDFTLDAPKSVSLALELGGDDRILDAFRQSVRETMAEIEKDVKTRVRKSFRNEDRETGNIIWAEHIHRTTRPVDGVPDAQLHCHATVFNITFDFEEQRWKAIQLGDIVRDKGYYQAAFHARLAYKLKDLGYGIEKDGKSFRLAGIDRETVEKFSRRTAVIEAEAKRRGIEDAEAKGKLGRRTREKKSEERLSMPELRTEWDKRLTVEERLAIKTAGSGWASGDAIITPEQAKEYALEHSFQNASTVSEKRLKAEALTYSVGQVLPESVADIAQHPEVIAETRRGQLMTTTKTVLRDEIAMLQFAKDGQRKQTPFVSISGSHVNKPGQFVSKSDLAGLSEEQKKAALHILNSRDTVTGVVGKAGTGKTTMMRATISAIEGGSGQKVFVFAPSSQASRGVLKREGFKDATTLESLLDNAQVQEKTKGQVVWVDEAGLVSSVDMRRLMDVAKRNGNRVILSGDYTQHASVEAGDAFRLLEKEAGVKLARLTEIRRQKMPGYKKAIEAISEGTGKAAQKGFDAVDKMGWVVESGREERHGLLVSDYLRAVDEGKSALIISPTHSEGDRLTTELREALKERGAIGKERQFKVRRSIAWTDAQKGDTRNYEPGMVLEWHKNAKGFTKGEKAVVADDDAGTYLLKTDGTRASLPAQTDRYQVYRTGKLSIGKGDRIRITKNGEAKVTGQTNGTRLNNGDIFTVEGFTKEGDIRLDNGKLLPKTWGHMTLGYVDTSYASQGKTVDRVFVAVGNESLPAANMKQWYVSLSRGREMAKVYVEDKQEVRDAIAKGAERLSAVELTHTKLRPSWRDRFTLSLERNRVGRFLKQRAEVIADLWRGREGPSYA
jgi:conjugative relaxase-like TrwC/TraI family protein